MTISHQPAGYVCPFCKLAARLDGPVTIQDHVVRRTDAALAFISPRWWPKNHGHVVVLYGTKPYPEFVTIEQRRPYAERLKDYFARA